MEIDSALDFPETLSVYVVLYCTIQNSALVLYITVLFFKLYPILYITVYITVLYIIVQYSTLQYYYIQTLQL